MPVVRLAKIDDYESFNLLGRTMYRVTWCDKLCPGNPTDSPAAGIQLFNEWQCAVAAGHEMIVDPYAKLEQIVSWCLANPSPTTIRIAADIVSHYKRPHSAISIDFDVSEYAEPGLAYRYELAFLNEQVLKLPAMQVLRLQTLMQVAL